MALSVNSLKQKIVAALQAKGFKTTGTHAWAAQMAEAIAEAVVDEITSNAKANVSGGSSGGQHPII